MDFSARIVDTAGSTSQGPKDELMHLHTRSGMEGRSAFLKSEKIFDEPDVSQREEFAHDGL